MILIFILAMSGGCHILFKINYRRRIHEAVRKALKKIIVDCNSGHSAIEE